MLVHVKNIKFLYPERETIFKVSGPDALMGYHDYGYLTSYNSEVAPKAINIEINTEFNPISASEKDYEEFEAKVKAKVEEELALTVKSFDYVILR